MWPELFCAERKEDFMREKKPYKVIAFETNTRALEMEAFCEQKQIPGRMIPLPQEISAGCGLAFRMLPEDYAVWMQVLETVGPAAQGVYDIMMF